MKDIDSEIFMGLRDVNGEVEQAFKITGSRAAVVTNLIAGTIKALETVEMPVLDYITFLRLYEKEVASSEKRKGENHD